MKSTRGECLFFLVVLVGLLWACGGAKSASGVSESQGAAEGSDASDVTYEPPERYEDYRDEWKKVETAEKEGKPRTALEEVEKILRLARSTHTVPQIVKALIQRTKLEERIGEKDMPTLIAEVEKEIEAAQFPEKNLLHSIAADLYTAYFYKNWWRFYERTTAGAAEGDDSAAWSLPKLMATIAAHHRAALEHSVVLRRIPIALFDEVLVKGTRSRVFRPTLYDLIAHRAVDFFMSEELVLPEGIVPFEVNDIAYLLPAERFVFLPIPTFSTNAFAWHALTILQDLTRAHLRDSDPSALVDIELKRLAFVRSIHTAENRDEIYRKTLEMLSRQYETSPVSALIGYEIARFMYEKGNAWREGMENGEKMGIKKALETCEEVTLRWPESEGALLCHALSSLILRKSLQIQAEPLVAPEQPSLLFVKYRNVKTLYFRTVKISEERANKLSSRYLYDGERIEKIAQELTALPPRHEWQVTLADDGDLREHGVEVAVPPLERGSFVILCGTDPHFSLEKNALHWVVVRSTNIAFRNRFDNQAIEFFVADRWSGHPLRQATVEVYEIRYDYSASRYTGRFLARGVTDPNGLVRIPLPRGRMSSYEFSALIAHGGERVNVEFWGEPLSSSDRSYTRTYFFTDRAIYRPGQTVYFKGVVVEYNAGGMPKIVAGKNDIVELYDPNNQRVENLTLTTNEYGSFHGSFMIPVGTLNGVMTIRSKTGSTTFSVEEYKRPLFETILEPPAGSYRLGEKVAVEGKAISYAGVPLSDAKVQWYVEREVRFPFCSESWECGLFPFHWSGKREVVGRGETITSSNGHFSLSFIARPDPQIPKDHQPLFSFRVHVEVTDVNGETHAAERIVRAAYSSLNLTIGGDHQAFSNRPFTLEIKAANWEGSPVGVTGTVSVSRLKDPERLLRPRLFYEKPDRFLLDKASFVRQFPHDPYGDEDTTKRPKEKEYLRRVFDTSVEKKVTLDTAGLPPGDYLVEVTAADPSGVPVTARTTIPLRTLSDGVFSRPLYEDITLVKDRYEPGETAELILASGTENVSVILDIVRGSAEERLIVPLDHSQRVIRIPITENDRGNISVRYLFVKHGRTFSGNRTIGVPWTNKELKYEFLSFRSTLQPGAQESWRIRVLPKIQRSPALPHGR